MGNRNKVWQLYFLGSLTFMMESSTVLYGLANIPSLCYLHLGSFVTNGMERNAIVVCTRCPPKSAQVLTHKAPSIVAFGLCSLVYHSPDNNERVSCPEALVAIKEGARISRKRSSSLGHELDLLLIAASDAIEKLRAVRLLELRRIQAARTIQRAWIPIVHDPRREFKKMQLLREFDLLVEETEQLTNKRKKALFLE